MVVSSIARFTLTLSNARLKYFGKVLVAYRVIAVIVIVRLVFPVQIFVFFNLRGVRCGVSLYFSIYTITTGNVLPVSIMVSYSGKV